MAGYKEQMRTLWQRYRDEVSPDPVDLREVAAWAIKNRFWAPQPADLNTSFARDLADVLREEVRTDAKGRRYRANIPVKERGKDGVPLFKWADIDDAPFVHVEKSVQQERRSIASDCYALAMKVEHYNDAHLGQEPIQVPFDFSEDIEEMKIANGLEEAA
jgi:hypothetical protein